MEPLESIVAGTGETSMLKLIKPGHPKHRFK